MLEPQGVAFAIVVIAAISTSAALARFQRDRWRMLRTDRAVRAYARLFVAVVGVWILGNAAYAVAADVVAKFLGSVGQFQTILLIILVGCLVLLITMSLKVVR